MKISRMFSFLIARHKTWLGWFRRPWFRDLICLLILVLAGLVFFRKVLLSSSVLVAGDINGSDFTAFFLSAKTFLAQSLRSKQLPFWSSQVGCGFPFLAEGQIQALFPASLIFLFLSAAEAYNLLIFLSVLAIGVTTYFYLNRGLGAHRLVALFGAISFAFGAPITMRWKHLPVLSVLAFFPLELLVIESFFKSFGGYRQNAPGLIAKLGALIGLQLLAGHPQITLYCLVVTCFYFVFNLLWLTFPQKKLRSSDALLTNHEIKQLAKLGGLLLLAILLGLGLGAAQFLPSWELKGLSQRAAPLSYLASQEFPFLIKYLITLLVPFSFGNPAHLAAYLQLDPKLLVWEICCYSGLASVILGCLGGFTLRKRASLFFVLLFVFSVLQAAFNFLYFIPGFGSFRVPARFVVFISFSLISLAVLFVDDLIYGKVLSGWEELKKPVFFEGLHPSWVKLLLHLSILLLVIFSFTDLYFYLGQYNQVADREVWMEYPETARFIKDSLGTSRYFSLGAYYLGLVLYGEQRGWTERPEAYLGWREILPPNENLIWGLRGALVYSGVEVGRQGNFANFMLSGFFVDYDTGRAEVFPLVKNLLAVAGVKYVISPFIIDDPDFALVFEEEKTIAGKTIQVYEFNNDLPRAFFVDDSEWVTSEDVAGDQLFQGRVDPLRTVLIEGNLSKDATSSSRSASEASAGRFVASEFVRDTDQTLTLKVNAPQDGYLVLSDTYYPGWRAYVRDLNGAKREEVKILRANYNFRAIPISQGDHLVTFVYDPQSFKKGLLISIVSLGVIVSLTVYHLTRRRRDPISNPAFQDSYRVVRSNY